jgi:hypothetical protein
VLAAKCCTALFYAASDRSDAATAPRAICAVLHERRCRKYRKQGKTKFTKQRKTRAFPFRGTNTTPPYRVAGAFSYDD